MVLTPEPPPEPPPEAPEYDPDALDYLGQQQERYLGDEFQDLSAAYRERAGDYRTGLQDLAGDFAESLYGSESYEQLAGEIGEMRDLYEAGGLTDVTRANLEQSRREAGQFERAQREAAMADLAERGTLGGGAEIAALMGGRAAATDRMSARDLEANAFAQEQALQAFERASEMGQDRFQRDQDIQGLVLDYVTEGLGEEYDIDSMMLDAGLGNWNDIIRSHRQEVARAKAGAAGDVVPASTAAANALSGASESARGTARETVTGGTEDLERAGAGYAGLGGLAPPTLDLNKPPVDSNVLAEGGETGDAAGKIIATAFGYGGAAAAADEEEDDS